jgi:hypothetical protein
VTGRQTEVRNGPITSSVLAKGPQNPRVWAGEGWDVVVTDGEERTLDPADFEKLFEIKQVSTLTFGAAEPQPPSEPPAWP